MKGLNQSIKRVVKQALKEDIGPGDLTTQAVFIKDRNVKAYLYAKEDLVLAGRRVFEQTFRTLGERISFKWLKKDGQRVKKHQKICFLSGSLKNMLICERVSLNFIQRLSGIATLTNRYVGQLSSKKVKITDTRKTTPLLREFEKYAVKTGGGTNHRMGLYDGIMIKDNHIEGAGSISAAVKTLRKRKVSAKIEVETKNLNEVKEALDARADIIMLDNMSFAMMKKAVKLIGNRTKIEISGGVKLEKIKKLSTLKVDYISVGALTHSPRAVDISLEFYS